MTRWPTATLGEVCDVRIGRTPRRDQPRFWGGDAVWVTVGELNGGVLTTSKERISEVAVRECMPDPVPPGTLLFSFKLSIGKMAVAGCPLYTNEAIAALPIRNPSKLSRSFLRYALMAESREGSADTAVLGILLNKEKVRRLEIPLPPLEEQERLVRLLDAADEFQKLRAQADRRTDDLIPALFNGMFGDGRSFPTKPLIELVEPDRGISYGVVQRGRDFPGGVQLLRIADFGGNRFDPKGTVRVDPRISAQYKRTVLAGGELVVSIRGTVGRVAIVPDEAIGWNVAREVAVVPALSWVSRSFLHCYMLSASAQGFMTNEIRGIAQRGINLDDLRRLPVPLPPDDRVREFEGRLAEIRALEADQTASRSRLDALFQSLLHGAFEGEL